MQTHLDIFASNIEKVREMLKIISIRFGWTDEHRAYSALLAVLHTLRDTFPIEQAIGFGNDLPVLIRGFYYDGWKPSENRERLSKEDFISRVEEFVMPYPEEETEDIIKAVCMALLDSIAPDEVARLKTILPPYINTLLSN